MSKGDAARDQARRMAEMQQQQDALYEQQRQQLEAEQRRAQTQADQLDAENREKEAARRRRQLGRSSLINTSELGVTDKLGVT